jgi:uncharacterized Zn finger protein
MARRRYDNRWEFYPKTTPIPVEDGIKAKTRRGQRFGQTWWATRWIGALEPLMDSARLRRGRTYARKGQVMEIQVEPGRVEARVQGSRRRPYKVRIDIPPLGGAEWEKVIDAMAEQAIFAAKLLAGEMPADIEGAFQTAGVSLFPTSRKDLSTSCSCPDWANPCKHIAAVYYLLGERFDEDPFMIFHLRGRTKEAITQELRARRSAGGVAVAEAPAAYTPDVPEAAESPPPMADPEEYWDLRESLDDFRVTIAPPEVEAALLKRMGPPPFWRSSRDLLSVLGPVYGAVTARAMELAFGHEEEAE